MISPMAHAADAFHRTTTPFSPDATAQRAQTAWNDYLRELEAAGRFDFVPAGEALTAREVYIDLSQPCRGPIRALEGQMAGSRNRYLARADVPADVWCAIIEHCACVDRATGRFRELDALPSRKRLSLGHIAEAPAAAFAA